MLHFGRDLGRRPSLNDALGERILADPSIMQLLPLAALRAEAASSGLIAHTAKGDAAPAYLTHAIVLKEIARRTGEVETLGRAASAMLRTRDLAQGDRRLKAHALLAHAAILSLTAALFSDQAAAASAGERLDQVSRLPLDPVGRARLEALRAGLMSREALGARSPNVCEDASCALDAAAKTLAALAKTGRIDDSEAHEVRCDRAELLIGAGLRDKDRRKLDLALADLDALIQVLDAAYRPLTWARAETLRGQALAALGDLIGEAASIAEGAAALKTVVEEIPLGHRPLDAARAGHALGLVLQSLGEACDEDALFDRAVAAFAPALEALDAQPLLPLRAIVAHDGAVCLARRAERRGDLVSLERAEAAFRDALKSRSAAADPLSWAVTQVALARIYEAEAELRGDTGERADAAFALASALEVFAERGLRSLSDVALTALERVKAAA